MSLFLCVCQVGVASPEVEAGILHYLHNSLSSLSLSKGGTEPGPGGRVGGRGRGKGREGVHVEAKEGKRGRRGGRNCGRKGKW